MLEIYILLIFMIVGAILAVELRDLLSSVVVLAAVGLALCMTFLILKAPDVAITQLVIELLILLILIRATLKEDLPFSMSGRWFLNTCITGVFLIIFMVVAWKCLTELPSFGYPLMRVSETYLKEGVLKTGAANIVSAIILDYRAFDTLGEATILFTAVIGILAVVRKHGRKREDQVDGEVDE